MQRSGIKELRNECLAIEREGSQLWMCGVDDWLFRAADLEAVNQALPAESCAILLAHEPDFADIVAPGGSFDLMLSGHSHGGQIALPWLGPITLPPGGRKYPCGWYKVGDMALYTNRGLGVTELPVRIGARPELTVFTLRYPW
ncbi:hypothetical protein EON80_32580 [bacterium]|nr:MAG: hypothetical protein EON80_32580 [bacterium]